MARAVTGVDQRASRALGKYFWDAWEGVTVRSCCNWARVRRAICGCEFFVWDLVLHAIIAIVLFPDFLVFGMVPELTLF